MVERIFLCLLLTFGFGPIYGQAAAPYGVGFKPTLDKFTIVWHCQMVNSVTLKHDEGGDRSYYIVSRPGSVCRVLEEFNEAAGINAIDRVAIFIWGVDLLPLEPGGPGSAFELAIYNHQPQSPNDPTVWGPFPCLAENVPAAGAWYYFPVHTVSGNTPLYVEFRWLADTPNAPLPALDFGSGARHSFWGCPAGDQITWRRENSGNLMIRLDCNNADTVYGYEQPPNLPDSFAVFLHADSVFAAEKLDVDLMVRDSLHFSIPRSLGSGKFVAIAAWEDGEIGHRSSPIYLDPAAPLDFPLILSSDSIAARTSVDDSVVMSVVIANPTNQAITCRATGHVVSHSERLSWDSCSTAILPGDSSFLRMCARSESAPPGTYIDTLSITCEAEELAFKSGRVIVAHTVDQTTGVDQNNLPVVPALAISQNYPNPFNSQTVIMSASKRTIRIYDILGREVARLTSFSKSSAGLFRFLWDGADSHGNAVASGVYFYRQDGHADTKRMLFLK